MVQRFSTSVYRKVGRPTNAQIEAVRTLLPPALRVYEHILTTWQPDTVQALTLKAQVAKDIIGKFFPSIGGIDLNSEQKVEYGSGVLKLLGDISSRISGRSPESESAGSNVSEISNNVPAN
jgi:hypothetical protein